ncbi:hypothetical protein [Streptomyces marianii]|uniref:Uncharacterized protein n=1 Tax=Streptomyces marianii TaxID=1817406 RepID=A0A5R9E7N8_9ACTN|nr:hypothetical protein [Streptomyces marianii]TLQ45065.1 hypothetical protein FEF34_20230 [Streptomyces marianii]
MPTVPPHAVALSGMLAAATSSEPRITETQAGVRIEVDLPDELSPVTRSTILTALGGAGRYGHSRTEAGDSVWGEIDREAKR